MYVGSSALRSGATGSRDHGHDDEAGDQQPHASSDPERVQRGQEPHQEQGGPPDAWTVGLDSGQVLFVRSDCSP